MVRPTIVAGVNALGRGQDRIINTVYWNYCTDIRTKKLYAIHKCTEAIKRLAAAQGIDVLILSKLSNRWLKMQAAQQQTQQALVDQAGQLAGTPLMDPTKNPQ